MKTNGIFAALVIPMISFNCLAQGLEYKSGPGFNGPAPFSKRTYGNPVQNSDNTPIHFFNSFHNQSTDAGVDATYPKPVINRMAHNDEITEEQVRIIFDKTKEFNENNQLSIAFIEDGQVVFYGLKRQDNAIINIDNRSSVFEIGSITKIFTATLLANCVNNGTIDPDDYINNYLPFKLNNDIRITFRELANHTSGLPRNPSNMLISALFNTGNPYSKYSEDKLQKYLTGKIKITQKPGKEFKYSNIGFGILGYTLSKSESKSYNDLLTEQIFAKYGMMNSSANRKDLESKLVFAFNKNGSKKPNWDFASLESAGAVLSTTEDLSKFIIAQFDQLNRELALTREITFNIDENRAMGLGWFTGKTESGDFLYRHKGITGGYKSAMAFNINKKTGIVILSNVSGYSKETGNIETLCLDLLTTITKDN